jgi:parallel beta-helix repeat protein
MTTLSFQVSLAGAVTISPVMQAVNVQDFNAGSGGDDRARILLARDYAIEMGIRALYFPEGIYIVDRGTLPTGAVACFLPSNFCVFGDGEGRTIIKQTGVIGTAELVEFSVFGWAEGTSNIVISGIHGIGENGEGPVGFATSLNNQSAFIDGFLLNSHDILITGCVFDNLWGFPAHDRGHNKRIHFIRNKVRYCANGVNINASESYQTDNEILHSEGFESSGSNTLFLRNIIKETLGPAFSVGGAGDPRYGTIVQSNIIDGGTAGIIIDGMSYGKFSDNIILNVADFGIHLYKGYFEEPTDYNSVSGNNIQSGNVSISLVDADNCLVVGNRCSGTYGLNLVRCDWIHVAANQLNGSTADASLNDCTYAQVSANSFFHNSEQILGTTSLAPEIFSGVAETDTIFASRKWNGTAGALYAMYRQHLDGTMKFGPGNALPDVAFSRRATGILQTDGKLVAASGLGVGNATTGLTLPGVVVGKMPIYNMDGTLLGYVALLDDVT